LLGATAEVVAERGYERTRLSDIAARAGVSRGTFYELFEDLSACLLAAFEMAADCVCDLAASACGLEGEWEVRLRAALEEILQFLDEEPALAHLLGVELAAGVPEIAAARECLLERLTEMGVERHSLEGAFALVLERPPAGVAGREVEPASGEAEPAGLSELAPQLAELIRPGVGPGRQRRGAPAT
jgi:AcrR family transcriptional regulator